MLIFLQILVLLVSTALLVWGITAIIRRSGPLSEKVFHCAWAVIGWFMVAFIATMAVTQGENTIPGIELVFYAALLLGLAGLLISKLVHWSEDEAERAKQRTAGYPTEPRVWAPWKAALTAGIIAFFLLYVLLFTAVVFLSQLQVVSELTNQPRREVSEDLTAVMPWAIGFGAAWVVLVWVRQKIRWTMAWREYEQLSAGVKTRLSAVVSNQARYSEDA